MKKCFLVVFLFVAWMGVNTASAWAQEEDIKRVSISTDGTEANGTSWTSEVSEDGRLVAFTSEASTLVPTDNPGADAFVRDRLTGETRLVDIHDADQPWTGQVAISANGQFIVTQNGKDNNAPSGFGTRYSWRNLGTNEVGTIWTSHSGGVGTGINSDGRFITFGTAVQFVPDINVNSWFWKQELYRWDRETGQIARVSVADSTVSTSLATQQGGPEGVTYGGRMDLSNGSNSLGHGPGISDDGRLVPFNSSATNLVPGDTNGIADAFVRDMVDGTTTRVSVGSDGTQGNGFVYDLAISGNGRFVIFKSEATNLVPGDTNGGTDVFVHNLLTHTTIRVSLASDGSQANAGSFFGGGVSISRDGRFVAFSSVASNLAAGDTNSTEDVFVRDLLTGRTARVSVAADGTEGNNWSSGGSVMITADGRFVTFVSAASNLVPGDTNGVRDIFVASNPLWFLPVPIDIKPGSFPNSINLGSGGTVPVAIFSTATFDATRVDPTTVTLANAGLQFRGNGTPMASFQDVNGDGRLDLVIHVSTEALQLTAGDVEAVLEGRTTSGLRIRGSDSVRVVQG